MSNAYIKNISKYISMKNLCITCVSILVTAMVNDFNSIINAQQTILFVVWIACFVIIYTADWLVSSVLTKHKIKLNAKHQFLNLQTLVMTGISSISGILLSNLKLYTSVGDSVYYLIWIIFLTILYFMVVLKDYIQHKYFNVINNDSNQKQKEKENRREEVFPKREYF